MWLQSILQTRSVGRGCCSPWRGNSHGGVMKGRGGTRLAAHVSHLTCFYALSPTLFYFLFLFFFRHMIFICLLDMLSLKWCLKDAFSYRQKFYHNIPQTRQGQLTRLPPVLSIQFLLPNTDTLLIIKKTSHR